MPSWITSDTHFDHFNCIVYCNRPYSGVIDQRESIIDHWNLCVGQDDDVYHLGDFCLNHNRAVEIIPRLNGNICLVLGNHDAPFPLTKEKHFRMRDKYLFAGISEICMEKKIVIDIGESKAYTVHMSHLPPLTEEQKLFDDRYVNYRPDYNPETIYLHGHLHNQRYLKYNNFFDVGWDGSLRLYTQEDVVSIIKDPREFIPSRISKDYLDLEPGQKKKE